jgi:GNAT superfamily N-acetyltransferase
MRNFINIVLEALSDITYRESSGYETYRFVYDNDPDLFNRDSRIRYIDYNEVQKEHHFIAQISEKIIGMAGVQVNPDDTGQLWIKFISVDPEYQGQGIAKKLLLLIYQYCDKRGFKMAPGSFSEEGERLRHLHDLWDIEFPKVAFSRNDRGDYINSTGKIVRRNDKA